MLPEHRLFSTEVAKSDEWASSPLEANNETGCNCMNSCKRGRLSSEIVSLLCFYRVAFLIGQIVWTVVGLPSSIASVSVANIVMSCQHKFG